MSREAPPDSPADPKVAPPEEHHAILWLALPLIALGLPVAYRLALTGDLEDALRVRFVSNDLELFWYAACLVSAVALLGFMAARRRGRALWPAMDVIVGAFPWVVALAAQSLRGEPRYDAYRSAGIDEAFPWGLVDVTNVLVTGLTMSEARGVGALMSAALWASAAVGLLLPHAEAPRWRGAGLVIVTLPAWAVACGFLSSGSVLPFLGAALLSGVVLFAGTQESPEARTSARASVLLASLVVIALDVSAVCETLVETRPFTVAQYFAVHGRLYDTLRAAQWGSLVMLLPAMLAIGWLWRRGDPPTPLAGRVFLAVAVVGMPALDLAGTRLALARITPVEWPPWANLGVDALPLGEGANPTMRGRVPPRFILARGELRDDRGERVALLSDPAALRAALASASMARLGDPMGSERGERLAIVPQSYNDQAAVVSICPGRVVSLLLDRSLTMADLRTFVAAAVANEVVELDVVGPSVLGPDAALALQSAMRAAGAEATWPGGSEAERAHRRAAEALPATGFPPADLLRTPLDAHVALLPSPCWLAQLASAADLAPGGLAPDGIAPSRAIEDSLNEVLQEAPMQMRRLEPAPPRALWLDPSRDVAAFLLDATASHSSADTVIWTLEPPAP